MSNDNLVEPTGRDRKLPSGDHDVGDSTRLVTIQQNGNVAIVRFDQNSMKVEDDVSRISDELLGLQEYKVVMDMQGIEYIPSMFLATLIQLSMRAGDRFVLCNLEQEISSVLECTNLVDLLNIEPDIDAARQFIES